MASASEAFSKFSNWQNLKTLLKVTVIVGGKAEDVLSPVIIMGLDPDAGLVGIAFPATRKLATFDVEDATFSVEEKRLVATRNESDWLVFEEE